MGNEEAWLHGLLFEEESVQVNYFKAMDRKETIWPQTMD